MLSSFRSRGCPSGNHIGLINAQQVADVVNLQADLLSLIEVADEVHTFSSLAAFDALIRNKVVVTYGLPFYAGWGLTRDVLAPLPYRERVNRLPDLLRLASALLYHARG